MQNNEPDLLPANAPTGYEIASPSAKLEVRVSDKESPANLSSRGIAVVLQIEQGHVTEAYIQNPQVGLGAYEATALRIARERRYRKDTKLRETVTLQVTPEQ